MTCTVRKEEMLQRYETEKVTNGGYQAYSKEAED